MNIPMPLFSLAMPEIFLLSMICVIMLVDVFIPKSLRMLTYILTQAALVGGLYFTYLQYVHYTHPIITFGGQYILDRMAILTKIFILFTTIFAFIYARQYIKSIKGIKGRKIASSEYYILGLFSVLGMTVMASAASFLSIYLGLELLSLPLYAMIALDKKKQFSVEAAMKYFIMGAMASALLLYGISMIYGATGSFELSTIAHMLLTLQPSASFLVLFGLIFILVGLLFKFGAVPFHMWVPDVYAGAPACMTLFIACAPKIATFCITMRILVGALPLLAPHWQNMLLVVALLSMFSGNLLAIAQTSVKRMLAYSSIAHIGYMLLGIIAGSASSLGYSAAMFYIVTYVIAAAGGFAVIALLSRDGMEFDAMHHFRGLNARNPWLAFMMLLLMFSMAGVPPTVGFFAKLGLLEALVQAHYVWLAALALLFAIIGAYYYLRIIKIMYFDEPDPSVANTALTLTRGSTLAVTVNAFSTLILGLLPSTLIDLCRITLS